MCHIHDINVIDDVTTTWREGPPFSPSLSLSLSLIFVLEKPSAKSKSPAPCYIIAFTVDISLVKRSFQYHLMNIQWMFHLAFHLNSMGFSFQFGTVTACHFFFVQISFWISNWISDQFNSTNMPNSTIFIMLITPIIQKFQCLELCVKKGGQQQQQQQQQQQ